MGRGKAWTEEQLATLATLFADGLLPSGIRHLHPSWSYQTLKKLHVKWKKDGTLGGEDHADGGKPRSFDEDTQKAVLEYVADNPSTSEGPFKNGHLE